MTACFLWRAELRRLLYSPLTWLAVAAVAFGGLSDTFLMSSSTMASRYLAQPISAACQWGTPIFALLTLRELSRVQRGAMDALCDSAVSPRCMAVVRLVALLTVSFLASLVLMLLYVPVAVGKLGIVFSSGDYVACFLLMLFPALAFSCIAAALCYQITRQVEISALLVVVFLMIPQSGLCSENFLWQWRLSMFPAMSDDFSNAVIFRLAAYTRLVWLCLLGGAWALSLLCLRRYGKGLFGSVRQALRRPWIASMAVCLLVGGGLLWRYQPFFDHSPVDWMTVEKKDYTAENVLLTGTEIEAAVTDTLWGRLEGHATYTLQNNTGAVQPLYLALNAGYSVKKVLANGKEIPFELLKDDYIASRHLRCDLPADETVTLTVDYGGMPRLWNAMQRTVGGSIISGSYIQLGGKELAPTPQAELSGEDTPLRLQFRMPKSLTLLSSGYTSQKLQDNGDGTATWQVGDKSTTRLSVFAGDYEKADLKGGGIPIEFYYSKKHARQMQNMGAIETMEAAIAFCTRNYGPRIFSQDRPFKIVQGTELIFGGFARDNLSAVSEDSFTVENLTDMRKGANGAEVLAHEIIHQWWGLGVMFQDESEPYWGSEGITTYTTYRLLKELRGEAYANIHYRDKWREAVEDNKRNFYLRNPQYRALLPEAYSAELHARVQGVGEYSGYALLFDRAAQLLGGEEKLDAVLSKLFQESEVEYISLEDFLRESGLTKEALGVAEIMGI